MNKKKIIIISSVAAVVIAAAVVLCVFLVKDSKLTNSSYGDVYGVEIIDGDELTVKYSAPYLAKNTKYTVQKRKPVTVSYLEGKTEKKISGVIKKIDYSCMKTDTAKLGVVEIYVTLSRDLEEGKNYSLEIKKGAFSTKKDDYKNDLITAKFKVEKDEDGKYESGSVAFEGMRVEKIKNADASIILKDGEYYIVINADVKELSSVNRSGLDNFACFASINYNIGNHYYGNALEDMTAEIDGGVVTITALLKKEDVIAGQDYNVFFTKGVLTNDDKSVVSDELKFDFTYVE